MRRSEHAMTTMILSPAMYYSYSQFLIFDAAVDSVGCEWTQQHNDQGFARRESVVSVAALSEFGDATVRFSTSAAARGTNWEGYERVILVPFSVSSGRVLVEGPEEHNVGREIALPVGHFRLSIAQHVVSEERLEVLLIFEKVLVAELRSQIIVADNALKVSGNLLEFAEKTSI